MSATRRIDRLVDLAADLRTEALTPGDYFALLAQRFTEREDEIHSFLAEDGRLERLLYQSTTLAERYPDADARPPLFGIPIGVKDIFHVEGFDTHAGSRLPVDELSGSQSAAVTTLEAAGALVLGKTVTTEFAYFSPGATRNPHDPARTPGGSSSGSAAAVAAGLCPCALGTQTIGSIGRPASYCGIVGFKPSYGRISAEGVIPLAPSLDHIGFFTRDVAGARLVASQLCDGWTIQGNRSRRPTLGVPEGPFLSRASDAAMAGFRRCLEGLASAGYAIRSIPALADFDAVDSRHRLLVAAEAARVHADWYERYGELYAPKTAELIEHGLPVTDETLAELRTRCGSLRGELETLMGEHGIDFWVSPAAPGPAPLGLESTGDPVMNLPWTHAGLPTISLPAWQTDGLPMGLQVAARFGADEDLLSSSSEIEEELSS